jgi:ankyrin repeat protein
MLAIRNRHYQLAQGLVEDFNADVHSNLTDNTGKDTLLFVIESALEKESPCRELCQLVITKGEYKTFELIQTAFDAAVALNQVELVILLLQAIEFTNFSMANIDHLATSLVSDYLFEALDLLLTNIQAVGHEILSYTSKLLFHLGVPPPLSCLLNHGTAYLQRGVNTLKVLTKWGADVNKLSTEHPTCLMSAVLSGHTELVEALIEFGADPFLPEPDFGNASPFFASIGSDYGNRGAFDIILTRYANAFPSRDLAHSIGLAAFSRPYGLEFIKALYDAKWIDIPAQCGPSSSILHYVIGQGFNSQSIVEFLLEKGAAVDADGLNGMTPVFCAIYFNKLGIVRLLLQHGASLACRGPRGMTPLHVAAALDNG